LLPKFPKLLSQSAASFVFAIHFDDKFLFSILSRNLYELRVLKSVRPSVRPFVRLFSSFLHRGQEKYAFFLRLIPRKIRLFKSITCVPLPQIKHMRACLKGLCTRKILSYIAMISCICGLLPNPVKVLNF
jgi:hypothetical protein